MTQPAADARRSPVLVLVGTDHHPFDRLVDWADQWAREHPDVEVVVQHGRSREPAVATGHAFLDHSVLTELMSSAAVVVSHGGPATISEARAAGHAPLVVPRDPAHGEHVDDHQLRFSSWLAAKGLIDRQTDIDGFRQALDEKVARGRTPATVVDEAVAASVGRFGTLVQEAREGRRPRGAGMPTVVYVAGFGRSGSTLVERLLGESSGFTCLGEVVHLWERGITADERCACGEPFSRCPTWQAIGELAFGGWHTIDVARVLELRASVDRQRRIPITALPGTTPRVRDSLIEYTAYYAAIYRAAAELSGSSVVVDSSKHTSLAFALSHNADIDLRVLHLVRDPRAVAYSWSKDVARPEVAADQPPASMPRYSAAASSRRWLTSNLLVEALRTRHVPIARIQYEDLVRSPAATLAAAAAALDLPLPPDVAIEDGAVELEDLPLGRRNPMRFATGTVQLREDDTWTRAMPRGQSRLVTGITSPLHRWYSRPGRAGPAGPVLPEPH